MKLGCLRKECKKAGPTRITEPKFLWEVDERGVRAQSQRSAKSPRNRVDVCTSRRAAASFNRLVEIGGKRITSSPKKKKKSC